MASVSFTIKAGKSLWTNIDNAHPERATLVSVGRYALRGVGRAQELFTIDPGLLSH